MLAGTLRVCDLASMLLATGVAAALLLPAPAAAPQAGGALELRVGLQGFAVAAVLVLVWQAGFAGLGLYEPDHPLLGRPRVRNAARAAGLNGALLLPASLLLGGGATAPRLALLAGLLAAAAAVGCRLLLRVAVRHLGNVPRRLVVIGTNPGALRFAERVRSDPDVPCEVIGFADDDWPGMAEFRRTGLPLVSDQKNFASFARATAIDEVVIALPASALRDPYSTVLNACADQGIRVRFLTQTLANLQPGLLREPELGDGYLLTFYNGTVEGWPALVKRVLDASLGLVLCAVLAPLFLATALVARIASPGPVFFSQERVGLNKRRFRMHKFRTMVEDADQRMHEIRHLNEVGGPVFKLRDDPRITPLGHWLRSLSLDELPQLLNVVKGEMSLVGPRPLPEIDTGGFENDADRRRFSVTPGLTGLWQVSGRSSLDFEEWMQLDRQYIDEWSLGLDLEILARTVPAVLRRDGAE